MDANFGMSFEKLLRLRDNLLDAAVAISEKLTDTTEPRVCDLAAALDVTVRALDPVLRLVKDNKPITVYSVVLTMVPPGGKIQVIKAVRACTNLPLQQAKEIVDEALTGLHPVVKLHATEAQAVSAVQEIVEAGGRAEMAVE